MKYTESSFHNSAGTDREISDKWKQNPLYKNGTKLSKSSGTQAYRGLKDLAKQNVRRFERATEDMGYIDLLNISGDSEDISFSFYFYEKDTYLNAKNILSRHEKNLNQIPSFHMDYYSLEKAVFRNISDIYKVELDYCFDYDSFKESHKHSLHKSKLLERNAKNTTIIYFEDGLICTLQAAKEDLIYRAKADELTLEDFKSFGGDTKTWQISDDNALKYFEDTYDWGEKTGGAVGFKIFESVEELTRFMVKNTLESNLSAKDIKVSTISLSNGSGIPESGEVDISFSLNIGNGSFSSYRNSDEASFDVKDVLENSIDGGNTIISLTKKEQSGICKFEVILTMNYDFIQTEGSY